jgi:hypothetical protein
MEMPKKCNGIVGGKPCPNTTILARGFCHSCYRIFKAHCVANNSWKPYMDIEDSKVYMGRTEDALPKREKWEYPGKEQELIAAQKKQK